MKLNSILMFIFLSALLLVYADCRKKRYSRKQKDLNGSKSSSKIENKKSSGDSSKKDSKGSDSSTKDLKQDASKNDSKPSNSTSTTKKGEINQKVLEQCMIKTSSNSDFCKAYAKTGYNYLDDAAKLKKAVDSFKEKFGNPDVNFLYEDLDKDLDKLGDKEILPTQCKDLVKNETSFCVNVEKTLRKYKNYKELNKAFKIFLTKKKHYESTETPVNIRKVWDPYFDYPIELEKASELQFYPETNGAQCVRIIERFIKIYKKEHEKDIAGAKKFCDLVIRYKRSYKTIGEVIKALGNFLKQKTLVLEINFDQEETSTKEKTIEFKDEEMCKNVAFQFKFGKNKDFRTFFCSNHLKNKGKEPIKAMEFENRLKASYENYRKNNKTSVESKYFDMTLDEAKKLTNIRFNSTRECEIDLPFLITIISGGDFDRGKVQIFCKNFQKFNRTYKDIDMMKSKLESFTKNYNKYHGYSWGGEWASLSVDDNKFFDFADEEYSKMSLGYIAPTTVNRSESKCGYDEYDKNAVIAFLKKTATSLNAFNAKKHYLKKKFSALQRDRDQDRKGERRPGRRNLSDEQKSYRKKKLEELNDLIEKVRRLDEKRADQIDVSKRDACPSLIDKPDEIKAHNIIKEFNHLKLGIINPTIYDQGTCGACWAFATVGSLESRLALQKMVEPQKLSVQYLLDCVDQSKGSCDGGDSATGLQYVIKEGIPEEDDYPKYSGKKEKCRVDSSKKKVIIEDKKKEVKVHSKLVPLKLKFILIGGPVVVHLDGKAPEFVFYKKGILPKYDCIKPNHSVLLVGYGFIEGLLIPYWIIKNSWGPEWGDNGYVKIFITKEWDACGVLDGPVELRLDS